MSDAEIAMAVAILGGILVLAGAIAIAIHEVDEWLHARRARAVPRGRHGENTIDLYRVPEGWSPAVGSRRLAAACDDTQLDQVPVMPGYEDRS